MPYLPKKLHGWRREGIVSRKAQLGREDAALERSALGSLDQGFPVKQVIFGYRAGGDAFWRVVGQGAVLLEEPAVGRRLGHFPCVSGDAEGERVEVVG
jgi:hypothetical protein